MMENWEYLDIHLSRRLTLKTNPESPPKIKDEQSVFPKDSKLHQLYNKMMEKFLCLTCGKHSALCT